jgi:hypothetical protein
LTTRFKECAKHHTRAEGPGKEVCFKIVPNSFIIVELFSALSQTTPSSYKYIFVSQTILFGELTTHLRVDVIRHENLVELMCKVNASVRAGKPDAESMARGINDQKNTHLMKSSTNDSIEGPTARCTVTPRKEKTFGDVHPSTPMWRWPG